MKELIEAYYALLNGHMNPVSDGQAIGVFIEDIPATWKTHYILLRGESQSYAGNKSNFADDCVVITDIVTVFPFGVNADRSIVEDIDSEMRHLIFSSPSTTLFVEPSGLQFLNTERQTVRYLEQDDGSQKYYRKVSRYNTRVLIRTF